MKINILHISDLHISKKKLSDIKKIIVKLLIDIQTIQKQEKINIDLIIFSGDLISKGENAKEEYKLAMDYFINPLLTDLQKNTNNIFLVPGNHDIERNKTSKAFEDGMSKNLVTQENLDSFFENFEKNKEDANFLKEKLTHYSTFVKSSIKNKRIVSENYFHNTYHLNHDKIKIGILALNSAWRSSGFGDDDGRLILGNSIIDLGLEKISDCDLKLAISHHPISMLTKWDQKSVKNILAQNINILFTGHLHDSDFIYEKPILGKLYVSTAGAIFQGKVLNGYSILSLDLAQKKLTLFLRRWYEKRGEFDQETEKCQNGKIVYENFELSNAKTNYLIEICNIKEQLLKEDSDDSPLLSLEDLTVKLNDVFVEPILSDQSSYEKGQAERNLFSIDNMLHENKNIVFYGRKEFGKTCLLKYIGEYVLRNDTLFESKIPIYINFIELPINNFKAITKIILSRLHKKCSQEQVEKFLDKGSVILMIDDYDSNEIDNRDKRKNVLEEFMIQYSKCIYFFTITETLSMFYNNNYNDFIKSNNASLYYLLSFNTSKIRELLKKWNNHRPMNVNEMLNNIIYFFQQLQIPVTPMNVTLFIGVLFRDKNKKNIKNEAYLIENYLETVLEKLQDNKNQNDYDFREKESFLAYIAQRMVEKNSYKWTKYDFERECQDYFEFLDEDHPSSEFFDAFFKKGIFQHLDGHVIFRYKFWFSFFLAKAMQSDPGKKEFVLNQKNYLRFATALSYKAGLDRNDIDLLDEIHIRLLKDISGLSRELKNKKFKEYEISDTLIEYSKEIEIELKQKNNSEEKDITKDKKYLGYDDEDTMSNTNAESDDEANLFELVTLYSDIMRNTREISAEQKKHHLSSSINSYQLLMWESLELFKRFIESSDSEEIKKIMLKSDFTLKKKIEVSEKDFIKLGKKLRSHIITVIPLSIIIYMSDHLTNTKFAKTINGLISEEKEINSKLFYGLLLLTIDFKSSTFHLKNILLESDSYIIDGIIFEYLISYCFENEIGESELAEIFALLKIVREKYSKKATEKNLYLRDTFISDIKEKMTLIKFRKR